MAGLSFVAANLGTLELLGWSASAYQYGMLAAHWYWIGAVPAMLFLGMVMIPFYYVSKAHSVPGYLKLRYGEGTRLLSALSFAAMTVLMSGINMYSMAVVMKVILGWNINFSILVSTVTVGVYVALGGLLSAIVNEVVQFVLIWAGTISIPILGLIETGGWKGMLARIAERVPVQGLHAHVAEYGRGGGQPDGSALDRDRLRPGLHRRLRLLDHRLPGCAAGDGGAGSEIGEDRHHDRRRIQNVVAGDRYPARTCLGLAVLPMKLTGETEALATGGHSYNEVMPLMMARYLGPGFLGIGVTALIAGFMSGMAGNISAFATVWTYDIYRPLFNRAADDAKCLAHRTLVHGHWARGKHRRCLSRDAIRQHHGLRTGVVRLLHHSSVRDGDYRDAVEARQPRWRILGAALGHAIVCRAVAGGEDSIPQALAILALSSDAKPMAENLYRFIWSWLVCVLVTILVSLATRPKPAAELQGLVYGFGSMPSDEDVPLYRRPIFAAGLVAIVFVGLNLIFW